MGHVWVSRGYSFRFMGQESVRDTRILNSTVPESHIYLCRYPAVENLAVSTVSVDSNIKVGHEDVVHGAAPLVAEEGVRHPDLARLRDGEVLDLVWTQQSGAGQLLKR